MSTNCVSCVKNKRTGLDLLCDACREVEFQYCEYYKSDPKEFKWCPIGNRGVIQEPERHCYNCPRYKDKVG